MTCETIEAELVAFHFGTLDGPTRQRIEAHLPGCPDCLRSFLALKRAIELGEGEEAPSEASRHRLRRAVAEELGVTRAPRAWGWWERPFAFGFAGAAVLIAVVAVQSLSVSPGTAPRSLESPEAQRQR